jgi:pimeloyl-ACP methyl ester carboxylesterase
MRHGKHIFILLNLLLLFSFIKLSFAEPTNIALFAPVTASSYSTLRGDHLLELAAERPGFNEVEVYGVSIKKPVLIVPGIMGSFSSCLFDPICDNFHWEPGGPFWCNACNIELDLTSEWVLDPIDCLIRNPTYESLIHTFLNDGYIEDETLFSVPYDWRNRNQQTAIDFLEAKIQEAKLASGHSDVDVVAHSMGGLVTRYYIEALDKSDVRQFVMLGTPNRGSAKAYYPWEGGDFSNYDNSFRRCFIEPMIEDMKVGYDMTDLSDREFIQAMIPSVKQLLPVDEYLYNLDFSSWIPLGDMVHQNDIIPELNLDNLISKLGLENIGIGAGTGNRTLNVIGVHESVGPDWIDGIPHEIPPEDDRQFTNAGDDTVPLESALLPDIQSIAQPVTHDDLPHHYRQGVLDFIADRRLAAPMLEEEPGVSTGFESQEVESLLFVGTRDNILMGIIAPDGSKAGFFTENQTERIKEIPNCYYRGNSRKTAALGIYDPPKGKYTLVASTLEHETEYEIYVSFRPEEKSSKHKRKLKGDIRKGKIVYHTFGIGQGLELY